MHKREDEMEFTPNERIEEAVKGFQMGQTEDSTQQLTEAILTSAVNSEELLAPAVPAGADGKPLDLDYMTDDQIQDFLESEEISFAIHAVTDEDGHDWLPVFTSPDAVMQGEVVDVMAHQIETLMAMALDTDMAGIVINPWSDALNVPADTLKVLLDSIQAIHENVDEELQGDINLIEGDIVNMDCDAIVNAANNTLMGGSGVDGAIHQAAGPELNDACRELHGCRTGEAKITEGFQLPADYIIHTVGPIYDGSDQCADDLADCYWNCLNLAIDYDIHSIAFPAISTGVFGYPMKDAAEIAVDTVLTWLDSYAGDYDMQVTFCVHDDTAYQIYTEILDRELADEPEDPQN